MIVFTSCTAFKVQLFHLTFGFLTMAMILTTKRSSAFLPQQNAAFTTSSSSSSSCRSSSNTAFSSIMMFQRRPPVAQQQQQQQQTARLLRLYQSTTTAATTTTTTPEYGIDMDQNAMMESDMLVTVDINDVLVQPQTSTSSTSSSSSSSSCSKKQGHTFTIDTPRGVLHRAFSFFLFNEKGEMLLTQRASSKITFPSVWTNTCCSHPLWGMIPNEVDIVPDAYPQFHGIKHAAIRKVKHELGINLLESTNTKKLQNDDITFISRFHYWASDTITHGPDTPWGEHEVDYILFLQLSKEPEINANLEEVSNYKYVSLEELKDMMYNNTNDNDNEVLLWSPWFRGIMERGGFDWWSDLKGALEGKYTNEDVIFFDPPSEHYANYNLPSHTRLTGVLSDK